MNNDINYTKAFADAIKQSQDVLAQVILPDGQTSESLAINKLLHILDSRQLVQTIKHYEANGHTAQGANRNEVIYKCKRYLVKRWVADTINIAMVWEKDLFKMIQDAGRPSKESNQKIAIYEIGECVVDWS